MTIYPLGAGFAGDSKASRSLTLNGVVEKITNFMDERMSVVGSLVRASLRGRDFWILQVLVPIVGFLGMALSGLVTGKGIDDVAMVAASAVLWVAVVVTAVYMGVKSAVGAQAILSMYMGARKMLTWSYVGSLAVTSMIGSLVASVGVVIILLAPSFSAYSPWVSAWIPLALVASGVCSSLVGFAVGLFLNRPWARNLGVVAFITGTVGVLISSIPSYTTLALHSGIWPALSPNSGGQLGASSPWSNLDSVFIFGMQLLVIALAALVVNVWVERSMKAK